MLEPAIPSVAVAIFPPVPADTLTLIVLVVSILSRPIVTTVVVVTVVDVVVVATAVVVVVGVATAIVVVVVVTTVVVVGVASLLISVPWSSAAPDGSVSKSATECALRVRHVVIVAAIAATVVVPA